MAASNSEKQSSKSSDGDESSSSPSERQKSSPASVDGGSSRWKYHVFLSFRGEDTRNNLTDHLYAALIQKGIYKFMDDERLQRGTEISSELATAIEESRFSIVIFSKNYASSTRCLEELAKIVECMETNNHTVIPVFYHVDPYDVRIQKGEFKRAFDKHQQNFDYNKVQRWRAALTQVSKIAGWHLSYDRHEEQCIKDIVDVISRRLNITFSNFSGDLVGMNRHLNMINAYLEVESDDVSFIGIWGMGGIGKTTIARAVFEKISYQYEASCFLGNIRAGYERSGLVALQEQLLSDVLKKILHLSDVYEGIYLIRRRPGRKKVLVVLDDVDQLEQLNKLVGSHDWFGPKSRIIVATRDKHVLLKSHAINYMYEVGRLNHDDALQLLRMKAFKNKNPMDDHVNLSKHIVNYALGIPLALEVLGSYLCDRTVEQWKSALDSLQDYPNGKFLNVLRLSYDGLNQNKKDIFLDIAYFFKGKNKDRVIEMLDHCDFYSTIEMKVLVDKSLITMSYNKLEMHDLLQEMGWEIVREQQHDDRGKWSRLWMFKDVHQVFADNRGMHAVEGIMLNKPKQKILPMDGKSFSNMSNLRLLKISNVDVSEDLIYLSNELQFFKWNGYPLKSLPSNFEAHKLFGLNLCRSRIRYLWKDVKSCPTLLLSHCSVTELPDSYGVQMKHESEIASQSLEHRTDVPTTSHISPPELSKLSTESTLPKLPVMVEKQVHEGNCRKEKLLDRPSTSRLSEVKELQLPDSNVVQNTEVSVTSNRPTPESPTPLPEDSSAKHVGALDTSSAATEISSDTDTDTDDAINVSEISQLKRLPRKLYSLKIESCKALESLTEELMSVNLQQLYIIDCQYLKSIQASHLPIALKTLYIRRCKKLEFLFAEETTGKHTSVEHLCIESSCDPLKSFPLALFPKLRNLSICDCANFNSISITEDHNALDSLEIQDCRNLESLWKSGLGTPKLSSILLSNCKKLKQLPGQLHGLTSLQSLFIKECPELDSIPVGGLPSSLNFLRISSCHKLTPCLQWGLHQLNKFISFEIEGGCRDLESFPEQNLLPWNLNSLQISRFPKLKVLSYKGLQHLTSLQTLKITSCDKLQFLPEEGLPSSLSYLYISDCPLLKSKLQNRRGSEWYKIAHIPHIQIDGKVIS